MKWKFMFMRIRWTPKLKRLKNTFPKGQKQNEGPPVLTNLLHNCSKKSHFQTYLWQCFALPQYFCTTLLDQFMISRDFTEFSWSDSVHDFIHKIFDVLRRGLGANAAGWQ